MEWTRERVLDAIRVHIDRHARPPLSSEWRRPDGDQIPATHVVISRFGTWLAAIAAAETGRPVSKDRPAAAALDGWREDRP